MSVCTWTIITCYSQGHCARNRFILRRGVCAVCVCVWYLDNITCACMCVRVCAWTTLPITDRDTVRGTGLDGGWVGVCVCVVKGLQNLRLRSCQTSGKRQDSGRCVELDYGGTLWTMYMIQRCEVGTPGNEGRFRREVTAAETISGGCGHEGPAHAGRDCQCRKNRMVFTGQVQRPAGSKAAGGPKLITADGLVEGF